MGSHGRTGLTRVLLGERRPVLRFARPLFG
jgi:hypothetical protein